jgi:ABC-2 type transport system ATP-binding protein
MTNSVSSEAVHFEDVTCRIEKRIILDRICMGITRGEITGILGPNGAGKTTLLSVILGLRSISEGRVTVLGETIPPPYRAALRRQVGVVFQETTLYEELTVQENLAFSAALYGLPDAKLQVTQALEILALSARAHEQVRSLSGGLQRRVTIARALLHSPKLLIIDEPTLGVDVEARHAIWSHLRMLRSHGITVIVSTNYLDEAVALCDTVAVLRAGKLLARDTPEALAARAGYCLDIECAGDAAKTLAEAFTDHDGVLRVQPTASGISIFLRGSAVPESAILHAMNAAKIKGFRGRGADLAEVFQTLEKETP